MGLQNALRHVIRLICKDDLAAAIQGLRHLIKHSKELDAVILQSTRYGEIKRQIREGKVDFESEEITRNQIRVALLDIVREMEDAMEENPEAKALVEQNIADIMPITQVISIQDAEELVLASDVRTKEKMAVGKKYNINNFFKSQNRTKLLLAGLSVLVFFMIFRSEYSSSIFQFNKSEEALNLQTRAVSGYEEIQSNALSKIEESKNQLEEKQESIAESNSLEGPEIEKNNVQLNKSPTKGKETLKVIKSTSLRESPKSSSKVLKRLKKGASAIILEKTNRYWWRVSIEGKVGYIKASLLE